MTGTMSFYSQKAFGSSPCLITPEKTLTYDEVYAQADLFAPHFKERCVVFILCKNSIESITGYLGALRAGCVPLLLSATIEDSLLQKLQECYHPKFLYAPATCSFDGLISHHLGEYRLFKTGFRTKYPLHKDLSLLLSTSGSTGSPKFVRLSHQNLQSNAESIADYLAIKSHDRPITTLPMQYSYGLSVLHSHWLKGAGVIVTQNAITTPNFWKEVKELGATSFAGVPFTYECLKKLRFEKMDLPTLRYLTQAGGKLRPQLASEFADICKNKKIGWYVMYGQTEATARMSYQPWNPEKFVADSIGIPIPGGEFSLGDGGELIYRGKNVCLGYAQSFQDIDLGDKNKGVLQTGDIARKDGEGFYYLLGRKDRFLKIFGLRVSLSELEQLLFERGLENACTGNDDGLTIHTPNTTDKKTLKEFVHGLTGIHPSGFEIVQVEKIPRNEAGKILYGDLKKVA